MVQKEINKALIRHGLDDKFHNTVKTVYEPLANEIAKASEKSSCFFLGVQGCQGSGKSTLADFLQLLLQHEHGKNVAVLSLDDFYLTRQERIQLAETVHPLLVTRGVPGTHDTSLAMDIFAKLKNLQLNQNLALPGFNKATDDRAAEDEWKLIEGPVDIVIFEGWCIGAGPQQESELIKPINTLEEQEDKDGSWRQFVNAQLGGDYQQLFSTLDKLVVLNAPSFDCVYAWRSLQETKLAEKVKISRQTGTKLLSSSELRRFISHYERLTTHCIKTLPQKADWLLPLNSNHEVVI